MADLNQFVWRSVEQGPGGLRKPDFAGAESMPVFLEKDRGDLPVRRPQEDLGT